MFEAASILTTLIAALGVSSLFNGRFAGSDVFPDCVQDGGRLQLLSGDHRYDRYGSLHPLQPPRKGPPLPAMAGRLNVSALAPGCLAVGGVSTSVRWMPSSTPSPERIELMQKNDKTHAGAVSKGIAFFNRQPRDWKITVFRSSLARFLNQMIFLISRFIRWRWGNGHPTGYRQQHWDV